MCGLLAEQKQRLCRVSSAERRCCARSASSSRAPLTLRMLCWPSSANERLTSNISHGPRRLLPMPPAARLALLPTALGTGADGKAWRKLLWKKNEMKLFESCKESCMNMCFFYTIKQSIKVLRRAAGILGWYLLQDPSAVTGHGKVSQERERQLLNSAVIGGDSWSELHHRVHQRVAKQRFRAHCRNRAAAAKSAASWKQNTEQNIGLRVRVQTQFT